MKGAWRTLVISSVSMALFLVLFSCQLDSGSTSKKNVIFMISDGCGYNQIKAANLYLGVAGQDYESFPVKYAMSTWEYNQAYDPLQAWSSFPYVTTAYTDSASAATAMSCGYKTVNGNIAYSHNDLQPLKHAMEYAEENGYATGVITTVEFSHATPAGFVAHNVDRNNYAQIAAEMINLSAADVIMGAGHPLYSNDGILTNHGDYKFVGGQPVWDALVAGTAGASVDANHDGTLNDAWTLIQTKAEFEAYADDTTPDVDRLCGVVQAYTTTQQARTVADAVNVYQPGLLAGDPFITSVPSLATMSKAALNVLNRNEKGFVLMIEGGAIDWACHAGQSNRTIEEEIDFNQAVDAVIDWVEANSSWNETLLIVTGDHETGYLWGTDSGLDLNPADGQPDFNQLTGSGSAVLSSMAWFSDLTPPISLQHTNSLIPLFAKGRGSNLFSSWVEATDPVRGEYIDNASVGKILIDMYR